MKIKITLFLLTAAITSKFLKPEKISNPDEYCLKRENKNCLICSDSLLNPSTGKCEQPETKIDHCYFYTPNSKCEKCQYNYTPSEDILKCEKIKDKNCLDGFENKKCSICKFPFLPNENLICKNEIKCEIENCVACGVYWGVQLCNTCGKGFAVRMFREIRDFRANDCKEEVEGIRNCWYLENEDENRCSICEVGFFMDVNGLCVKSTESDMTLFG